MLVDGRATPTRRGSTTAASKRTTIICRPCCGQLNATRTPRPSPAIGSGWRKPGRLLGEAHVSAIRRCRKLDHELGAIGIVRPVSHRKHQARVWLHFDKFSDPVDGVAVWQHHLRGPRLACLSDEVDGLKGTLTAGPPNRFEKYRGVVQAVKTAWGDAEISRSISMPCAVIPVIAPPCDLREVYAVPLGVGPDRRLKASRSRFWLRPWHIPSRKTCK